MKPTSGLKLGESLPSSRIVRQQVVRAGQSRHGETTDRRKKPPDPVVTPVPESKLETVPDLELARTNRMSKKSPVVQDHVVVTKTLGKISLDEIDALRDEIVRTLSDDGGEVSVKIIVTADKSDGFSENTAPRHQTKQ